MHNKKNKLQETTNPVVLPEATELAEVTSLCNMSNENTILTSPFLPNDQSIPVPVKVMFLILIIPAVTRTEPEDCAKELSRIAASFVGNSAAKAGGAGMPPNI